MAVRRFVLVLFSFLLFTIAAGASSAQTCPCDVDAPPVEQLTLEVINRYPHDPTAFTQGLLLLDGTFYESTGQYGQSDVRQVEIETGEVLRKVELDERFFAEGLAQVGPNLIQLTWRENVAIVWDIESLEVIGSYLYETEGWGLCHDGEQLFMTDGSSNLFIRDPISFRLRDMMAVQIDGEPQANLNELECVGDSIYANVWQTDTIVRIDKTTGFITGVIDASSLLTEEERAALEGGSVLNGIAYNPDADTFYITGKNWPALFEVRFVPAAP